MISKSRPSYKLKPIRKDNRVFCEIKFPHAMSFLSTKRHCYLSRTLSNIYIVAQKDRKVSKFADLDIWWQESYEMLPYLLELAGASR